MNGRRVRALRTDEHPHPGRKHGGSAVRKAKRVRVFLVPFDHKKERRSRRWK